MITLYFVLNVVIPAYCCESTGRKPRLTIVILLVQSIECCEMGQMFARLLGQGVRGDGQTQTEPFPVSELLTLQVFLWLTLLCCQHMLNSSQCDGCCKSMGKFKISILPYSFINSFFSSKFPILHSKRIENFLRSFLPKHHFVPLIYL